MIVGGLIADVIAVIGSTDVVMGDCGSMSFHPQMPYGAGAATSPTASCPTKGRRSPTPPENRRQLRGDRARTIRPSSASRRSSPRCTSCRSSRATSPATRCGTSPQFIGCTAADVEDVVTYYVMFFTKPVGTYVLQVCRTLSCALNGAEQVTDELCSTCSVKPNETTADGMFTVMEFECLGACDRAPVVMVNNEHWHECQAPEDVPALIEGLRTKGLAALTGCHLAKEPSTT